MANFLKKLLNITSSQNKSIKKAHYYGNKSSDCAELKAFYKKHGGDPESDYCGTDWDEMEITESGEDEDSTSEKK